MSNCFTNCDCVQQLEYEWQVQNPFAWKKRQFGIFSLSVLRVSLVCGYDNVGRREMRDGVITILSVTFRQNIKMTTKGCDRIVQIS